MQCLFTTIGRHRLVATIAGGLFALALCLGTLGTLLAQEGEQSPSLQSTGANDDSDLVETPAAGQGVSNTLYMPLVYRDLPHLTLFTPVRAMTGSEWTVFWSDGGEEVTDYELHESTDPTFAAYTVYNLGPATTTVIAHDPALHSTYYYRVRANGEWGEGHWSNVVSIIGPYTDDFSDSSSGWTIRRQDTDDVNNSSYYENGQYVLKIGGRWDYGIASPLVRAPALPYRLETNVILDDPDNLNSYGIIFGADWNGDTCPNSDYSSCFNHYYRLNIIWFGSDIDFRVNLKRIDSHSADDNGGVGVTLIDYLYVNVGNPDDWNTWAVEVTADGWIKIFVDNTLVAQANDATYINDPYFGLFASSDEYLGSEPHLDYYSATFLDSSAP